MQYVILINTEKNNRKSRHGNIWNKAQILM